MKCACGQSTLCPVHDTFGGMSNRGLTEPDETSGNQLS